MRNSIYLFLLISAIGCKKNTFYNLQLNTDDTFLKQGAFVAKKNCSSCHSFIEPSQLTRENWNYNLAYMAIMLGINDSRYVAHDAAYVQALQDRKNILGYLNKAAAQPLVSSEDWWALRNYYLYMAPERQPTFKPSLEDLNHFSAKYITASFGAVTCIAYDKLNQEILVGYGFTNKLARYSKQGNLIDTTDLPGPPIGIHFDSGGFYLTIIGDLFGRMVDHTPSKILFFNRGLRGLKGRIVVDKLIRTAHTEFVDIDADGDKDIVLSAFKGYGGGGLWLLLNQGNFKFKRVNIYKHGSPVQTKTHDFNKDGFLDIATLFSNVNEELSIFYGKGILQFEKKTISKKHAAYGFVSLEMADIDQDGKIDLLTANGDNSDNGPYNTMKPYHGIRIFYQRANKQFEEKHLQLQGATIVKAADIDDDGDIDIAATANFADFSKNRPLSFVIFENTGKDFIYRSFVKGRLHHRFSVFTFAQLNDNKKTDIIVGTADFSISQIENKKSRSYHFNSKKASVIMLRN